LRPVIAGQRRFDSLSPVNPHQRNGLRVATQRSFFFLEPSPAFKQVDDQDNHGNYQQKMNQTAANVNEQAKKPEHEEDNNYSPKHGYSFRFSETSSIYLPSDLSIRQAFSEYESKQLPHR
jgi:hypothetical protein